MAYIARCNGVIIGTGSKYYHHFVGMFYHDTTICCCHRSTYSCHFHPGTVAYSRQLSGKHTFFTLIISFPPVYIVQIKAVVYRSRNRCFHVDNHTLCGITCYIFSGINSIAVGGRPRCNGRGIAKIEVAVIIIHATPIVRTADIFYHQRTEVLIRAPFFGTSGPKSFLVELNYILSYSAIDHCSQLPVSYRQGIFLPRIVHLHSCNRRRIP